MDAQASYLAGRYRARVKDTYRAALRGFSANMTEAQAELLAADPEVAYVEQDRVVHALGTQPNPPSWGLDRIDQRNLPLDNSYTYPNTASNVNAYIIDTGIRITHDEFAGRISHGIDTIGDGQNGNDCNGHGTHVAGTVGGTDYGAAKGVHLFRVRVLNCSGSGTTAQVVAGIDWVTANHVPPAVAVMGLGGGVDTVLDNAVSNSIASGVSYVVLAGNSNADACNFSPGRVTGAITVGATTINDARASFSNFGTCLDIFAPGSNITSAWNSSDTATNTISGTAMATAHAGGAAALILGANPAFVPHQVRDTMVADATTGVVTSPGSGSPNRLLFVAGTPTAVDVIRFNAVPTGRGVVVYWRLAAEADIAGYNVFRVNGRRARRVNARLIPAKASGTGGGSTYRLRDAGAAPRATHSYRLDIIHLDGTRSSTFTSARSLG